MFDEAQLVLVPLYTKHKTKSVLQQFIIEYIQIVYILEENIPINLRTSFQTNVIFLGKIHY